MELKAIFFNCFLTYTISSLIPEAGTIQIRLFCDTASGKEGQSVKELNGEGLVFYAAFAPMSPELTFAPVKDKMQRIKFFYKQRHGRDNNRN